MSIKENKNAIMMTNKRKAKDIVTIAKFNGNDQNDMVAKTKSMRITKNVVTMIKINRKLTKDVIMVIKINRK